MNNIKWYNKKRITLAEFKREAFKRKDVKKQYVSDKEGWWEYRANFDRNPVLGNLDE